MLNKSSELTCEESKLYLIEEIFKHKVVVIIAGGELHILACGEFGMKFLSSNVKAECAVNVTACK